MFVEYKKIPSDIKTGFPITQAVIDGTQEGKIYNNADNFFVVHKAGFCSLIQKTDCMEDLLVLFQQKEIPQYFHIYDAQEDLIQGIQKSANLFNIKIRERVQFQYQGKGHLIIDDMDEYQTKNIDESNLDSLSIFNLDLEKRFWGNKSDFINHALGVVVFNNRREAVSICYAAAVANGKSEVDVMTKENYRGKGIAKIAVAHFVENCLHKKIIPNWDCFDDNLPSINTAKRLSFISKNKYKFISIFKNNSNEN